MKCGTRGFLSSTGWRSKLARWVFCWILAGMGVINEEPFGLEIGLPNECDSISARDSTGPGFW